MSVKIFLWENACDKCDEMSVWRYIRVTYVTICPCDEMSFDKMSCDEIFVWRNTLWQNVAVTKCRCDKISQWPNVCDEMSYDEISCPGIQGRSVLQFHLLSLTSSLFWLVRQHEPQWLGSCITWAWEPGRVRWPKANQFTGRNLGLIPKCAIIINSLALAFK